MRLDVQFAGLIWNRTVYSLGCLSAVVLCVGCDYIPACLRLASAPSTCQYARALRCCIIEHDGIGVAKSASTELLNGAEFSKMSTLHHIVMPAALPA